MAAVVSQPRRGEQYLDRAAVLATPRGFEVLRRTTGPQPLAHSRLFASPVGRSEDFDSLADDLVSCVAEQLGRSRVPTGDDPVVGQPDDSVAGAIDDCGQSPTCRLRDLSFGDVDGGTDDSH